MTKFEFPAFIKLEKGNSDPAKAAFLADVDSILGAANTKVSDFGAAARRNLDSAFKLGSTGAGGLNLDVPGLREAAAVQQQRAQVAQQLAAATLQAATAQGKFDQATRLSIAATKQLAIEEQAAANAARVQADAAEELQRTLNATGLASQRFGAANDNVTRASAAQRQGLQQLGYQLGDVATMWTLGAKPAQIFGSQIGQITQAIQLMAGGTSRFAAFLGGPWGIALSTAAIVAAPFIGTLWEIVSGATAATGALDELIKKQRQQQAEKNRVSNAGKDIDALVKRRDELQATIAKRGGRVRSDGTIENVYKEQKDLKEVNRQIMEGRAALDAERASAVSLDRIMGDLAGKRLKDAYAIEKQTKAKIGRVRTSKASADKDELKDLQAILDAEVASIKQFADWNKEALGKGLDRGTSGMFAGLADKQAKATDGVIRTADAQGAWNDQLAETVRMLDQIGGAGSALGDIGRILGTLSRGNLGDLPGPAGIVGRALGGVTWSSVDNDGNRMIRQLGDEFGQVMDKVFGSGGSFAQVLESAGIGAASGQLVNGKGNSGIGSAIGGALGEVAGKALGKAVGGTIGKALGPLGSIAGGILGGALGGVFKNVKSGYAQVRNGEVAGTYGRTGDLQTGAASVAAGLVQQISSIARTLNTKVGAYDFDVGKKNDKYVVNTGVRGVFNFDTETEALEFAVREAVADGAFVGLSDSAKRLLQNGGALQDQIAKAVSFQGVFRSLKAFNDPLGAAIDDLNNEFSGLIDIFKEAGASTTEFAQLEELYGKRRAEAVADANDRILSSLQSLKSSLTIGSDFYSLRDRQASAVAVFNPLRDRVAAGDSSAFDAFSEAAEQLLQIERAISGSTGAFFARADEIRALTDQAIAGKTALSDAAAASDSPFSALATQQQATVSAIDAQTAALIAALESQLGTRLDAINDNLITTARTNVVMRSGSDPFAALSLGRAGF